jgi:hypothetical protein
MAHRKSLLSFLPDIIVSENEDCVTVKAGRHVARFPTTLQASRYADERPALERANEHADMLRKSYGSRRPSYRFRFSPRGAETTDHYNERRAVEYARWLAGRDGIEIPKGIAERIDWSGVNDAAGKWRKRVCAVEFGTSETEHHGHGRKSYTTVRWSLAARIEIPNWDFVPSEPVEYLAEDETTLAPVAPAFKIPARFLLTTCLAPVNDRHPVAPSLSAAILRVA